MDEAMKAGVKALQEISSLMGEACTWLLMRVVLGISVVGGGGVGESDLWRTSGVTVDCGPLAPDDSPRGQGGSATGREEQSRGWCSNAAAVEGYVLTG